MRQSITLNLGPHLPDEDWRKIADIYRGMDGWIEDAANPCWYGRENDDRWISVSSEPGGLLFEGVIEAGMWTGWMTTICARLTLALGRPVHDAEM